MNLALQITHKGERRVERLVLGEQAVLLGRSWDSDIILDDKYVDGHHLRLSVSPEGTLMVQDLSTLNGSYLDKRRLGVQAQEVALGATLVVGDTHIKVYDQAQSVASATVRSAWYLLIERFSSPLGLALLTVLALGLDGAITQISSSTEFDFKDLALELIYLLVIAMVLALIMGLVSKLVRKEMNLKAHWVLIMVGIIGYVLAVFLLDVVRFNIQTPVFAELFSTLIFSGLGAIILVGFFSYATHLSTQMRWFWSLLLVGLLALSTYTDEWRLEDHQRWSSTSNTEVLTLPKWLLFRPSTSVEEHQAKTNELFLIEEQ